MLQFIKELQIKFNFFFEGVDIFSDSEIQVHIPESVDYCGAWCLGFIPVKDVALPSPAAYPGSGARYLQAIINT